MSTSHDYAKILDYITDNPLAVIGTVDGYDQPQGAVVYVTADRQHPVVYFVTKTGTEKYKNLIARKKVSLTIFDAKETSTLQATGKAFLAEDTGVVERVMTSMAKIHAKAPEWMPPLAKLRAGAYVVIGVKLHKARLAEFKGHKIGSKHIFTHT